MKTKQQRVSLLLLASAAVAFFASSCSTVRGVGQDVGRAGDHIEHAAR